MKIKRVLFIFFLVFITFVCLYVMNLKFDPLARYSYGDEETREYIKNRLDRKGMEYIVEYSIDCSHFIDFMPNENFNIYFTEYYEQIKDKYWYLDYYDTVDFVNGLYKELGNDFMNFIDSHPLYSVDDIKFYLKNLKKNDLVIDPENPDFINNKNNTISTYKSRYLKEYDGVLIRDDALSSYHDLINHICEKYNVEDCGIKIIQSYLSYNQLDDLYKNNIKVMPGNNYHQLGVSLDLDLKNSIFKDDYSLLTSELSNYNFIIEDCPLCDYHIRYIKGN